MLIMNDLREYQRKRNFTKTKEPKGTKQKSNPKRLKFVVQHHKARKDHYDLRLEWNGVYVSFAIPKGPSYSPKDKRLAIKVEDHPISYGNFEGIIEKGEYGAGIVMLFDKGYWYPEHKVSFNQKVLKFRLDGQRLKGMWSLVKLDEKNYLLIKEQDEYQKKTNGITKYKTSIKTGRTFAEIAAGTKETKETIITNPDKIIFKEKKVTKQDIVNYYKKVSTRMFPYLENRLISTVRAPSGIDGDIFFMKHLNSNSKNVGKKKIKGKGYYYLKNVEGIIEEVQNNSYEFHIWGCKQNQINFPDILVFDFDPDEKLPIKDLRQGILHLKTILDQLKLKSYLKTSGGKGYHVFVPLKTNSWKKTEEIAKKITTILVEQDPNKYTMNMTIKKREGKIFIDYFRNKKGATSVCPYSLRLKKKAAISCPIFWKELNRIKPSDITIFNIDSRLQKRDPWLNFFDE